MRDIGFDFKVINVFAFIVELSQIELNSASGEC